MDDLTQNTVLSQPSVDLGARLKYIREYNGLSQRELAKRAGVPHSSISMIEQGANSPSVNSLAKILGGIPMSIAQFFSCDLRLLRQQVFRASDLLATQRSLSLGITAQTIPLQHGSTPTRFERLVYAANADTGETPQLLTQPTSGYILSGAIEFTLNAEVVKLTVGDAFSLGAMQPFRFRNLSPSEACVILTCSL